MQRQTIAGRFPFPWRTELRRGALTSLSTWARQSTVTVVMQKARNRRLGWSRSTSRVRYIRSSSARVAESDTLSPLWG